MLSMLPAQYVAPDRLLFWMVSSAAPQLACSCHSCIGDCRHDSLASTLECMCGPALTHKHAPQLHMQCAKGLFALSKQMSRSGTLHEAGLSFGLLCVLEWTGGWSMFGRIVDQVDHDVVCPCQHCSSDDNSTNCMCSQHWRKSWPAHLASWLITRHLV